MEGLPNRIGLLQTHLGWVVAMVWATIKLLLFLKLGIVEANDSTRYIAYAEGFSLGKSWVYDFDAHYFFYSLVIASSLLLGIGLKGVVAFQLFCSGLSAYFLYLLAKYLFHSSRGALWLVLYYTCWLYAQCWDFYILSDSLFVSLSILIGYVCLVMKGGWRPFLLVVLVGVGLFLRPNGFVLLLAVCVYEFAKSYRLSKGQFVWWCLGIGVALPFGLVALNKSLMAYFSTLIMDNYITGEIISGYKGWLVNTKEIVLPDKHGVPLAEMGWFTMHHPWVMLQLVAAKLFFYFGHIRPYYSQVHNCLIVAVLWPAYALAIRTVRKKYLLREQVFFVSALVGCQAFVVALYMEDWDGRFLLPVLPYVFLLAIGPLAGSSEA